MADLEFEQSPRGWFWVYQTPGAGFYRAPKPYRSRAAAAKAGKTWLQRRAQPRNRGR